MVSHGELLQPTETGAGHQIGGGKPTVANERILIVDSSEAFATMLKEGLESSGSYQVVTAGSGTEALDILGQNQIDLAIIDMGLEDMDGPTLVESLRQSKPDLSIMLIPLFGQELEDEALSLKVQGFLPKPFFIGDLPRLIQAALTGSSDQNAEVEAETLVGAPEPPPAPRDTTGSASASRDVNSLLEELFREIRATAVLFIRGADLIAHAGNITRERAQELAGLTEESLNAAQKIAAFLGETDNRFEQCTLEGNEYNVYSMNVTSDTILSVALSARTPVGIVRYNLRRTVDELAKVWRG